MAKNALSLEVRKLAGLVSLNERAEWNLKKPSPEELSEADKIQMMATKLKAHADTLANVSKELSQKTGNPMEFYMIAGDLLSAFGEMLGSSGDKNLAKPLKAVAGKLSDIGNANRHTNNWNAVPTGEAVEEAKAESFRDDIVEAMARALFVSAWADAEEEAGRSFGGGVELMDVAPKTSQDAKQHAEKLAKQFEQKNGMSLDELLVKAAEADKGETIDSDYAGEFGHDLAMQAMGHGVSWFDDHHKFPLKVPHTEFYL